MTTTFERFLPIAAFLISLVAIIISSVQYCAVTKHYHVSLQPRLHAYFSNEEQQNKFGIYLVNNGLGPAYIQKMKLYLDNDVLSETEFGSFQSLIRKLNLNPLCFVWGIIKTKDVSISNKEEHFLIRARNPGADECSVDKLALFFTNLKRIKIEIEFESIYGDQFTYTYNPS